MNPQNAKKISPEDMDLEFVNAPDRMTDGCEIEFRATSFGTRHSAKHKITLTGECSFTEEQTDGPMRAWTHKHRFEATPDGQTRIIDEIEFTPPGGLVGLIVTESRIRAKLKDAFKIQHAALQQHFKDR